MSYLKLILSVKIVGEKSVIFNINHVNDSIYDWMNPILYISSDQFLFEKGNIFEYSPSRLLIPYKLLPDKKYEFEYEFITEEDRHYRLKKLYKNLILFSKSPVFKTKLSNVVFSRTLNLYNDDWYLY